MLASVIYKQYQAGFFGLSTAGNVVLFVVVAAIIFPLSWWLNRRGGRPMSNRLWQVGGGIAAILVALVVFIVPFLFIVFTAGKTQAEGFFLEFSWPTEWAFFDNIATVLQNRDFLLLRAFVNSTVLRSSPSRSWSSSARWSVRAAAPEVAVEPLVNGLASAGLIIPPAVMPTIWVLQGLELFKTIPGLIAAHVAFGLSFCILLFRAFVATIPRELDEARSSTAPGRSSCSSA